MYPQDPGGDWPGKDVRPPVSWVVGPRDSSHLVYSVVWPRSPRSRMHVHISHFGPHITPARGRSVPEIATLSHPHQTGCPTSRFSRLGKWAHIHSRTFGHTDAGTSAIHVLVVSAMLIICLDHGGGTKWKPTALARPYPAKRVAKVGMSPSATHVMLECPLGVLSGLLDKFPNHPTRVHHAFGALIPSEIAYVHYSRPLVCRGNPSLPFAPLPTTISPDDLTHA